MDNKLLMYISMLRPRYSSYPAIASFCGGILSFQELNATAFLLSFISGIVCLLLWWGGMVTNHILDMEIDEKAIQLSLGNETISVPKKERRPIVMGTIPARNAWIFAIIIYLLALLLIFFSLEKVMTLIIYVGIVVGSFIYNGYAKHHGIIGSFTLALLIALTFPLGGFFGGGINSLHIIAMVSAFLFHVNMHICGCIKDYDTDRTMKICTLPVKIGIRKSTILAFYFCLIGHAVALLPLVTKELTWFYVIPVLISGYISLSALTHIIKKPVSSSGWFALSANILSSTLLYSSFMFGVINL